MAGIPFLPVEATLFFCSHNHFVLYVVFDRTLQGADCCLSRLRLYQSCPTPGQYAMVPALHGLHDSGRHLILWIFKHTRKTRKWKTRGRYRDKTYYSWWVPENVLFFPHWLTNTESPADGSLPQSGLQQDQELINLSKTQRKERPSWNVTRNILLEKKHSIVETLLQLFRDALVAQSASVPISTSPFIHSRARQTHSSPSRWTTSKWGKTGGLRRRPTAAVFRKQLTH